MNEVPGATRAARRPSERTALVEYIEATPELQETEWLEWKSSYDLATSVGRGSTARQIIGFANRTLDQARRWADGFAYLILGAEPGSLSGMPVHDSADLENWLRPFVGDDILYDAHNVTAGDGVNALMITVDPPKDGDDIHSLQREFQDAYGKSQRRGTIYVRKSGKTEVADHEDIKRLTARARNTGTRLSLAVHATERVGAPTAAMLGAAARDEYLTRRREELLRGVPRELLDVFASFPTMNETRSPERVIDSVAKWVEQTRANWQVFAVVEAAMADPQTVTFSVTNESDENFEAVQLEVEIPLPAGFVLTSTHGLHRKAGVAEPPARWGQQMSALMTMDVSAASIAGASVEIESLSDDRTLVRFPALHVRPRSRHVVGKVVLVLWPVHAGETLDVPWRLTSTSTRGDISGALTIAVAPEVDDPHFADDQPPS